MAEPFDAPVAPSVNRSRSILIGIVGGLLLLFLCATAVLGVLAYQSGLLSFLPGQRADLPAPPVEPQLQRAVNPARPIQLIESFDTPNPLWEQTRAQVIGGSYELAADEPGTNTYGLLLAQGNVQDFDLAVDLKQESGDPTSEYGVRFRQQGIGSYTMCSISGSGYYRLVQYNNGQVNELQPWTFSPLIQRGAGAVNRMRVIAVGSEIRCLINNRELIRLVDPQVRSGQLTLGIATFDVGGLAVRFDNIEGTAEGIDIAEDFEQNAGNWSIGGSGFNGGGFEIFAGPGLNVWNMPLPPRSHLVEDFDAEVEVTWLDQSGTDTAYGLIFRDGGNFDYYALLLRSDGAVLAARSDQGAIELLPPGSINVQLGQYNSLRVEARGPEVTMFVDGQQVGRFADDWRLSGDVGMLISTGSSGLARARFDNFRLTEISADQSGIRPDDDLHRVAQPV